MSESFSFNDPSQEPHQAQATKTTELLTVMFWPKYHLHFLLRINANHPVPTNVNKVCISTFNFLSAPGNFSAVLSQTSFIYRH